VATIVATTYTANDVAIHVASASTIAAATCSSIGAVG
jgi:hypothetical protein